MDVEDRIKELIRRWRRQQELLSAPFSSTEEYRESLTIKQIMDELDELMKDVSKPGGDD